MKVNLTQCIVVLLPVVTLVAWSRADDWPMEGKTPVHKAISADVVTPPLGLAWKFQTRDAITASPIVKNGTVYMGGYDGLFHALDAASGTELWQFPSEGKLMFWAPAAVRDGVVVVGGCDGKIYARNAKTGAALWSVRTAGVISGGATIVGDTVYVGSMDNNLYALDLKTGKERWRFFANWYFLTAPVVDAVAHVVYSNAHDHMGYALDVRDGKLIWRTQVTLQGGFPNNGPPSLQGNRLFMSVHPGNFRCFDAKTGRVIWTASTGASLPGCVVVGDRVIVGTGEGLTAFNVANGEPLWKFKDNAPVSRCTPAVSGTTVYFCSRNGKVYGLNVENGQKTWAFATGSPIDGSPALANGRLYVTSCDGKIYCFAPAR